MNGWRYKSAMPVNQPACCSSHSLEYKCSGKGAAAPKTFTVTFQHSGTDFQGFFSLILYRLCKRPDEVWIMKSFQEKCVCYPLKKVHRLHIDLLPCVPFDLITIQVLAARRRSRVNIRLICLLLCYDVIQSDNNRSPEYYLIIIVEWKKEKEGAKTLWCITM